MATENRATARKTLRLRLRRGFRFIRQDLPSITLLKPRNLAIAGHILAMHQSGSHWLNNMLAACMIQEFDLPELEHIRDRSIVNGTRHTPVHSGVPRIIQSHEIPSPLVHMQPMQWLFRFPRYVFLVRDIRSVLVSGYEKKKRVPPFEMSFGAYLRNDRLIGNDISRDLWYRMRQLNGWNRDIGRLPADRVLVVRYEDVQRDTCVELARVWRFLGLPDRDPEFFDAAVSSTTKEQMATKERPGQASRIVRQSNRHAYEWFSAEDREYFTTTVDCWLNNSFGYDYHDWTIPERSAAA